MWGRTIFRSNHKIYEFCNNNKSPGNNGHTTEFSKHFSNELAPVFLDAYDSWGKLGTMDVTSRKGTISVKYKEGDKKDIVNYRPIYQNP